MRKSKNIEIKQSEATKDFPEIILSRFIIFFFVFLLSISGISQSYNQQIRLAKKHVEKNDYLTAGILMEDAYSQSPTPIIAYQCAEYYFNARNYKKAERFYQKVIFSDKQNFPRAYFKMAMAEKYLGKYAAAAKNFWRYTSKFPNEPAVNIKIAKYQKYVCEEILNHNYSTQSVKVNLLTAVNSEYSDFQVQEFGKDTLLFTSYRPRYKSDTTNFFSALYQYNKNTGIKLIDTIINIKNAHIPNFFYDNSLKLLLFTMCKGNGTNKHCSIYQSKVVNGKFSYPQKLNTSVNYPSSNNTQPFLTEIDGNRYLFFASDRQLGGYGGYDIFYCVMDTAGNFSIAINLGENINSPLNEITPYYDKKNKILYYSSQWFVNYGGYDIFKSHGSIGNWETPQNLGVPVNSSYDDVFYSQNKQRNTAYFSSNRLVNPDETHQCCNNIYFINLQKKENEQQISKKIIINKMKTDLKLMVPLTLYYDNDEPNPKTLDTVTDLDYLTTYNAYLQRINEYKKIFSKGKKGEEKQQAIIAIEDFFQDSIIAGYEQFQKGLHIMQQLLEQGQSIQITIKGFASPLNKSEYNTNLSKRRINCVENYLRKYNNGVFLPYLDTVDSKIKNKLYIIKNAFGETKAAANISDKRSDLRNSVYSPEAAKERKVQIIGINFK